MYCKNCGNQMDPDAAVCVKCGFQKGQGPILSALRRTDGAGRGLCVKCGVPLSASAAANSSMAKNRVLRRDC